MNQSLLSNLRVALEEEKEDGTVAKEKEYVWYGRILDMNELQKAVSTEKQMQSNMRGPNGSSRVRNRLKDGIQSYILTCKNYTGSGECDEVSQHTTKDMWLAYRGASGESMDKIRHVYPIEGTDLKWEVDVFIGLDGKMKEWCKIDLECSQDMTEFPPLPIQLSDVIFHPQKKYTPEQDKKVKELYATLFTNKL